MLILKTIVIILSRNYPKILLSSIRGTLTHGSHQKSYLPDMTHDKSMVPLESLGDRLNKTSLFKEKQSHTHVLDAAKVRQGVCTCMYTLYQKNRRTRTKI